jgi:hypothetical protein
MQDRYVADVGDFGKYGLLRCLTGMTCGSKKDALKLGVIWYLTPSCNGNANDGKHLGYLDQPQNYKACDPILYCELGKIRKAITRKDDRGVRLEKLLRKKGQIDIYNPALTRVQTSNILETDLFFEEALSADKSRANWWNGVCKFLNVEGDLLVFMDPDNGLRVRYEGNKVRFLKVDPNNDKEEDTSHSPKHVYIEEIKQVLTKANVSLVFYHHLGRHGGKHHQQIQKIAGQLESEFSNGVSVFCIRYRRGSGRAFFILVQKDHKETLLPRINQFTRSSSEWVKREHLKLAFPKKI